MIAADTSPAGVSFPADVYLVLLAKIRENSRNFRAFFVRSTSGDGVIARTKIYLVSVIGANVTLSITFLRRYYSVRLCVQFFRYCKMSFLVVCVIACRSLWNFAFAFSSAGAQHCLLTFQKQIFASLPPAKYVAFFVPPATSFSFSLIISI